MARTTRDDAYNPLWNHYKCADGEWLSLGMLQPIAIGRISATRSASPNSIDDERFKDMKTRGKNQRELVVILDRVFASKPRAEWMNILKHGGDFIYTVVNHINDLPNDTNRCWPTNISSTMTIRSWARPTGRRADNAQQDAGQRARPRS